VVKARVLPWYQEEIPVAVIANPLGRRRSVFLFSKLPNFAHFSAVYYITELDFFHFTTLKNLFFDILS